MKSESMSIQILSDRLTELKESQNQLRERIDQLANSTFEPATVSMHDYSSDEVIAQLVSEILQTMREQEEDFELLQEEVLDFVEYDGNDIGSGGVDNRRRTIQITRQQCSKLLDDIKNSAEELRTYQASYRQAQLRVIRRFETAQKQKRIYLTRSHVEDLPIPSAQKKMILNLNEPSHNNLKPRENFKSLSEEEKEVNSSSDVTIALRRTHDMMVNELCRSQFAHDTLKESTAALAQLSETYSNLDTILSKSKNLLGTLLRSQKSDTWYLETAFYVLLITLGWLIFRRLLYGPLLWFFFYPMSMFIKGWSGLLNTLRLELF